jgi:hypothetical protein
MTEYDPKDGEAAGIAAFNMVLELMRSIGERGKFEKGDALKVLNCVTQRPPMPGTSPPYQVTKHIQERLLGEVHWWNEKFPR